MKRLVECGLRERWGASADMTCLLSWNCDSPCCCNLYQEADLAVAPLTVTAVRERFVDMTTPFIQTGLSFIMRKSADSEDHSFSLLSPFSTEMWVGVLIAFLLTGLCVFLVGRWVQLQNRTLQTSFLISASKMFGVRGGRAYSARTQASITSSPSLTSPFLAY